MINQQREHEEKRVRETYLHTVKGKIYRNFRGFLVLSWLMNARKNFGVLIEIACSGRTKLLLQRSRRNQTRYVLYNVRIYLRPKRERVHGVLSL